MTAVKTITIGLSVAAAVILAGCMVRSACPFYTEKNLVFEDGNVIRGGEDTELALEKTLHVAISQLFNDLSFVEAILNSDKAATEINLSSQTSKANP